MVVKWNDNKPVMVMTNHGTVQPTQMAKRWSVKQKSYINVPMPQSIGRYNSHMGGVDLLDRLVIREYFTFFRTIRFNYQGVQYFER